MLRRITPNIIINYDGDDPGVHAEERAAHMFEKVGGFNLGIVVLPEKLDPDEYVKKYGAEKYRDEVKGALSPTDFFLKRLAQKYNLSNDRERITYLSEAVKEIAHLSNPVEQDIYLEKVAKQEGVSKDSLKVNLMRERRRQNRANRHKGNLMNEIDTLPDSEPVEQIEQYDPAQTRLLYLFMNSEEARNYILEQRFLFPDQNYAQLAELWLKYIETHEKISTNDFLDFIPEQLQGIIVNAEMTDMPKGDSSAKEIRDIIRSLKMRKIDSQLNELKNKIQDAERRNDGQEILQLTQKILELKRVQGQKEAF